MPYHWTCTSCGLRLYSAARDPLDERCPRCGSSLAEGEDDAEENGDDED